MIPTHLRPLSSASRPGWPETRVDAMNCLVTGGAGFIGSHLVDALQRSGHAVRVLDNLSSGHRANLAGIPLAVPLIEADIRDENALRIAVEGVDWVFHLAALVSVFDSVERPVDNHEINLTGTLRMLEAARAAGVKRVVFAASAAAYGNNPELPKKETMRPEPESPYALAKVGGEHYLRVYAGLYGLRTVALRYFNVYGPRQDPRSMYSGVISRFVECVRSGATPVVFGDGRQTRDFVYVADVVAANLLAAACPSVGNGEVFNIATGSAVSLLDILAVLRSLSGAGLQTEFRDARSGDIRHSRADIGLAREVLGFEPGYDLERGLSEVLAADSAGG